MALEVSVTTEGHLSLAMLGESGEFWPPGFRCTVVGLLPEADVDLFSHAHNLSLKEQSSRFGVQVH